MSESYEVLVPRGRNDLEGMYKCLSAVLLNHGEPSTYLGYLEELYQRAKTNRPTPKPIGDVESKVRNFIENDFRIMVLKYTDGKINYDEFKNTIGSLVLNLARPTIDVERLDEKALSKFIEDEMFFGCDMQSRTIFRDGVRFLATGICNRFNRPKLSDEISREKFRYIMCEYKPTVAEDSGNPEWSQGELDKAYDDLILGNGYWSKQYNTKEPRGLNDL